MLSNISYFWKLDSLANNGFRLFSVPYLAGSKIDKVTPEFLISKLGKPAEVWKTTTGIGYVYYTLNEEKLPDNHKLFQSQWLKFKFDKNETVLLSIENGLYN